MTCSVVPCSSPKQTGSTQLSSGTLLCSNVVRMQLMHLPTGWPTLHEPWMLSCGQEGWRRGASASASVARRCQALASLWWPGVSVSVTARKEMEQQSIRLRLNLTSALAACLASGAENDQDPHLITHINLNP